MGAMCCQGSGIIAGSAYRIFGSAYCNARPCRGLRHSQCMTLRLYKNTMWYTPEVRVDRSIGHEMHNNVTSQVASIDGSQGAAASVKSMADISSTSADGRHRPVHSCKHRLDIGRCLAMFTIHVYIGPNARHAGTPAHELCGQSP
jgi:hypothetical protein